MKRRWIIPFILAALLIFTLGISATANETDLPAVCEHCKVAVEWTPLSVEDVRSVNDLTTGHYYVAMEEDIYDSTVKCIADGQTVCLYLNGKTLAGTTRGFKVSSGGTFNIMGDGKITGRGTTAGVTGACGLVEAGGTLNQYGGTLTYVVFNQRHGTNGGVLFVSGTYNLYGGVVENGIAKTGSGGNVYVDGEGVFNMYGGAVRNGTAASVGGNVYTYGKSTFRFLGGSITGGTAETAGPCVYNRGALTISGGAVADDIYLNSQTDKGGPALSEMLTVKDTFTGNVTVSMNMPESGMDIGTADNAVITGKMPVLNSMLGATVSGGDIVLVAQAECEHCGTLAQWEPLDLEAGSVYSGHYYLDFSGTRANTNVKYIYVDEEVCLHLNGKTLAGNTRAFVVYPGGKLNIMGGGTVLGHGSTEKYPHGGAINITEGAEVNLYNGTLAYEASTDTTISASNGGVVNVEGTLNMYGGTVAGGQATNAGGTVFVGINGILNMSGGTIEMGKTGTSDSCIYNRGTVILSGSPSIADLYQKPNVENGGPALSDMLVIDGTFSGSVSFRCSGVKYGLDIGNSVSGSVKGASIKINKTTAYIPTFVGNDIYLTDGKAVLAFASDGTLTGFEGLQAAIDGYHDGDVIVLTGDNTEDLTVDKTVVLDLNGHNVTGFVSGSGTLLCKDSATDDYTVADGVYGSIPKDEQVVAYQGYLQAEKDGKLSFHKLTMRISAVNIRQREAGIYFTSLFAGDEVISAMVESYGVVLNAYEAPKAGNMETTSLYSSYAKSQWVCGEEAAATGTMLSHIMKDTNSADVNEKNAKQPVFGNVYIKTADGYLFGSVKAFDLKSLVQQVDTAWEELNGFQMERSISMYNTYAETMESWQLPNLKLAKKNTEAYASMEKSATGQDIDKLEGLYEGLKPYRGELHDHAATGGSSDGKQSLEVWKAYMKHLQMDFAAIVDHKQVLHMRLPEWDNMIFIGGSEAATTITDREGVKLHYNMIFADPEGLEAVLHAFPEFNFRIWSESDRAGCGGQMHFNYPSFTGDRFTELCNAIYDNGGFLSIVHPKSDGYVTTDNHADAWFRDHTGVEVFYTYNSDRDGWKTKANYELWTGMLAAGKKVYATSGNDEHDMPSDKALSTIYSPEKDAGAYVKQLRTGNFVAGPVGIRMAVGDTVMGGTTDFAGKRLVFSVGDFHKCVYEPTHSFRVDLYSNEGVVFSQTVSCTETTYFAIDAQEDLDFYRVEIYDTTLNSMIALGNPIWND